MREIAVSKFKATCLGVLEDVRKTKQPIRITRFGRPVAEIVPIKVPSRANWLGCMKDEMDILGDIVAPVNAFRGWTGRS